MEQPFEELMSPRGEYRLSEVALTIHPGHLQFTARLVGPAGANVWARAWVSDETKTLAETAAPKATAEERVTIDVAIPESLSGCIAVIRIESQPLETEHILMHRFA